MVKKKNYYKKYGTLFSGESNPFNAKTNRNKHSVLGSDVKGTKGLPSVSKGINNAKRKEFLKKNKIAAQKSNSFIDKRKTNSNDHVTGRFVREGQNKSKKNIFNLNCEQEVKGKQSSKNLLDFGEENESNTTLAKKSNFGSFVDDSNFGAPKTHKEIIEDMIADSKQKKMERKMEKEKYLSALEEVDNAWRELHSSSSKKKLSKILTKEPAESNTKDLFDVSKYELKFEQKCSSISHTKSAEEIATEEQKRRIELEKEKHKRMHDNIELNNSKVHNHVSADAICDEYEYLQPITVEDRSKKPDKGIESDNESIDSDLNFEEMDEGDVSEEEDKSFKLQDDRFMSDIPEDVSNFKSRIKGCDAEQLNTALKNILKKYIKSKNEKVLNKLENFFEVLLQYAMECCEKKFPKVELIGALPPHLHALANAANLGTTQRFLQFLDDEYQIFTAFKKRRMKKNFPRPQTIIILKFAGLIYSTSDFRHPVVTPAMILMCDILGSQFLKTFANIVSRLLISELVLNCITESKRFVPEAVHFLNNLLCLAVPEKSKNRKDTSNSKLFDLKISNKVSVENIPELDLFQSNEDLSEESKKLSIIFAITNQLVQFATLYSYLPSFKEIFAPTLTVCAQLPVQFYPMDLKAEIEKLVQLGQKSAPLRYLSFQKAKPKPLKMFEPVFESKYNQKDDINKKRKLIKKVAQKIKKEEKSMLREIRRDAQVVASEKLKERLKSDAERKRKVKEIYGSLAVQEGEFKKMMKKKS